MRQPASTSRPASVGEIPAMPTSVPIEQRIAVVIGSTRPTRICADIAAWTCDAIQDGSELAYELLDLAQINLPFLDEPLKAALHQYEHEHTRSWSRLVQSYDGFLFVFPQYNWGYPAVLKNALDYLYEEWHDKPASFLTYGTRGGNKAADQFTSVMHGLHMRVTDDHVEAVITDEDVDGDWQLKDVHTTLFPVRTRLAAIDFQLTEALEDAQ
jgi:NAD(P)H-dependent FMN reductase